MAKEIQASRPTGYDALAELALNLRWSWNHATDEPKAISTNRGNPTWAG